MTIRLGLLYDKLLNWIRNFLGLLCGLHAASDRLESPVGNDQTLNVGEQPGSSHGHSDPYLNHSSSLD